MRVISAIGVAVLVSVLTACATDSPSPTARPLPSNPDGMPAGQLTTIDMGVEMSAGNRLVTLSFIGGPILPASNPCYTGYQGWARAVEDVLEVAVILAVDIHPTPSAPVCSAVGERREVQVFLDKPFLGALAKDRSVGRLIQISRPSS